ncbi:MAG: response regulator [Fimbriimonadaceae bacterium]
MIRVMVVDDHPMVRAGLQTLISSRDGIEVVAEADNGYSAVARARAGGVDVVLMDMMLPKLDGIEAARQIKVQAPEVRIVMLTSHLSADAVREAIKAGASGYVLKDVTGAELSEAIIAAHEGRTWLHPEAQSAVMTSVRNASGPEWLDRLTAREVSVLKLLAQGRSNKEIGSDLGLTEGTVKGYVSSVLAKMGVADRTQAALAATKLDLG